jgi:hypothetical protein
MFISVSGLFPYQTSRNDKFMLKKNTLSQETSFKEIVKGNFDILIP